MSDGQISIRGLYKIFGPDPQTALELVGRGISKQDLLERHHHVIGLSDISIEIAPHQLFVVMGLSGSGKSTLIRHINRLIEPTAGKIEVDGLDVLGLSKPQLQSFRRKRVSMVFQKFALFPHKTVLKNVSYGLEVRELAAGDIRDKAERWIELVGLSGFEQRYPRELSGGMQQRVGLARALATDAQIILMDEAFSALDPLIRAEMQDLLLKLQKDLRKTIVFITHDLDEALKIADRIAILNDGVIAQQGGPQDIIMRPADDYIESFIRDINRARVIKVRSVMLGGNGAGDYAGLIDAGENLENAVALLTSRPDGVIGVTRGGEVIGHLPARRLLQALKVPAKAAR